MKARKEVQLGVPFSNGPWGPESSFHSIWVGRAGEEKSWTFWHPFCIIQRKLAWPTIYFVSNSDSLWDCCHALCKVKFLIYKGLSRIFISFLFQFPSIQLPSRKFPLLLPVCLHFNCLEIEFGLLHFHFDMLVIMHWLWLCMHEFFTLLTHTLFHTVWLTPIGYF